MKQNKSWGNMYCDSFKRGIAATLLGVTLLTTSTVSLPAIQGDFAVITYTSSQNMGTVPTGTMYQRYKIETKKSKTTTTNGTKETLGSVKNSKTTKATVSGSWSKTQSRSYSLSASIPLDALKEGVKATIGGSVSNSTTVSLSASKTAKAGETVYFYFRWKTKKHTYSHTKQTQTKLTGKNGWDWKNIGASQSYSSTVTEKIPELIL